MTTIQRPAETGSAALEFTSLTALHAAHGELLRRHRTSELSPELLDQIEWFSRRGQATGALLDNPADREAVQTLLDYWDTVLYRAGRETRDPILADFDVSRAPELDNALCPYIGLDAFRESSHDKFFGRERPLDEWLRRLREQRLFVVTGPSGSGKSSLVLGGLLPALRAGALAGSRCWRYLPTIVPGSDPLISLARATRRAEAAPPASFRSRVERFRQDPERLSNLLAESGDAPAVVVVDQFEEIFTLCGDDQARQAFAENLVRLAGRSAAGHLVILTMRSDFEPHLARLPELQPIIEAAQVRVGPLLPSELREAIERPAALVGLKFEPGIVDELVQDMRNEPAGLPLLQFTLLKLWEQRTRNRVTREAYTQLGGVRRALERSADRFYERLTREQQEVLKRILLRMVRPDKGLEVTSSRVLIVDLYSDNFSQERVDLVLGKLISARLVRVTRGETPADDQVEVAHEALVRNWQRLIDWLEEDRDALRGRLRLTATAEDWDARGQPTDALLRGEVLAEALRYDDLPPLVVRYLASSQTNQRRERARRHRAIGLGWTGLATIVLLAMLLLASQLQQEQAEARLALSRQLVAQASAALKEGPRELALLLSIEAVQAQDSADARTSLLTSLAYSPESVRLGEHATAVKGVAFSPDGQILASVDDEGGVILWSSTSNRPLGPYLSSSAADGTTVVATGLAFSQDGSALLVTTDDNQVIVWCVASRMQLSNPAEGCSAGQAAEPEPAKFAAPLAVRDGEGVAVWESTAGLRRALGVNLADLTPNTTVFALSPDGRSLAGGARDGRLSVWDAATGQPLEWQPVDGVDESAGRQASRVWLPAQWNAIRSLAYSRDGSKLAWGRADGVLVVWHLLRNKAVYTFDDSRAAITSLAFGPGDKLSWGTGDGKLFARDLSGGTRLPFALDLSGETVPQAAVAVSPDGRRLAAAGPNHGITLLGAPTAGSSEPPITLSGHSQPVTGLAFARGGRLLASGSRDGTVRLWDPDRPESASSELQGGSPITSLALSPDGDRLASGGEDGRLLLWSTLEAQAPLELGAHDGAVTWLTFSPDGQALASVGGAGVRYWDLSDSPPGFSPVSDDRLGPSVQSVAFSPDGRLLALGAYDGTLLLWDVVSQQRRAQLRPPSARLASVARASALDDLGSTAVTALAFPPDGAVIASGSHGGDLTLWNLETGQPLAPPFKFHSAPLTSLSFSPDSRSLASGSTDFPLVLWSLDLESLVAVACSVANRNLTDVEWRQALGDRAYETTCPDLPVAQPAEAEARQGGPEGDLSLPAPGHAGPLAPLAWPNRSVQP